MDTNSNKRSALTTLFLAFALAGCAGEGAKPAETTAKPSEVDPAASKAETQALVAQIGVEPGPVQQSGGALAALAAVDGQVEVRRLGEESFAPAGKDDPLYQGDQVRAGDGARATILFADESTAELAEVSALAIGSRVATADPASSAAVLSGVARFSVSPRAPGEGPFLVFTSAGVVATKGTVFGVGVAADGDARVGVESGAVEVAGAAALDAPSTVEANGAIDLTAAGNLGATAAWADDDWGVWRDGAEADIDVKATAALHADAMAALASELDATYTALASFGGEVASFEAEASAQASANDSASYTAGLPKAGLAIDASFLTGLRLEYLTHAYVSHALLAADLYVRHPEVVMWPAIESRVQAAVLWPKRLDAMAALYFEPLRIQYYLHHPRGRVHAQWVGVAVPAFYASVTPPAVPSAELHAKLKFKAFAPSSVKFAATARPIWIAAPEANWRAKATFKVAPPRAKVAFWVRPPQLRAKALLGASVKAKIAPAFAVRPPAARAELKAKWNVALGHKIKVAAPDLKAAAQARANWKAEVAAPDLDAEAKAELRAPEVPDLKAKVNGQAKAGLSAKLDARAKAEAAAAAKAKAAADAKAAVHAKAAADAKATAKSKLDGASASLKVKAKAPEIKAPEIKAEAKGRASFKLGN